MINCSNLASDSVTRSHNFNSPIHISKHIQSLVVRKSFQSGFSLEPRYKLRRRELNNSDERKVSTKFADV